MKKSLIFIKNKLTLLLIVAAGTMVGGFTTATVLATADNGGQVHSCYNDNTKALSVSTSGNCTTGSSSLSWIQFGGPVAYAHITFAPFTMEASIDTPRSKNITDIHSDSAGGDSFCATMTGGTPKNVSTASGYQGTISQIAFKDAAGWSTDTAVGPANFCSTNFPSSNIGFSANAGGAHQTDAYITVY